jgi:hypothetical protein
MACYCGIATKANKIKWLVAGILGIICAVFFVIFLVAENDCGQGKCLPSTPGVAMHGLRL